MAEDPKQDDKATTEVVEEATSTGPPPKKKRTADRQITKDDSDEEGKGDETSPQQPFRKASSEVLKGRRIVKARIPGTSNEVMPSIPEEKAVDKPPEETTKHGDVKPNSDATKAANPFASVSLESKSGGGLGFGKFATSNPLKQSPPGVTPGAPSTFGSAATFGSTETKTSTSPSGLGVFGRGAAISGFGTAATGSSGFNFGVGSQSTGGAFGSTDAKKNGTGTPKGTTTGSIFAEPEGCEAGNGEENETCAFQVRAKLFQLVEKDVTSEKKSEANDKPVTDSEAPPAHEVEKKGDKADDTPVADDEKKSATPEKGVKAESTEAEGDGSTKQGKHWKEIGIGPVRILHNSSKAGSYRIVQRRENSPGGAGTKLILNVKIQSETAVNRHADKYVRLSTLVDEKTPGTFLFKVKNVADGYAFVDSLQNCIDKAGTVSDEAPGEKKDA